MQKIRNLGRVLAALWLVGVLVLGVGGSILTRGGEKPLHVALSELHPEGSVEERIEERVEKREKRRDDRALGEEGWGTDIDEDGGWGADY